MSLYKSFDRLGNRCRKPPATIDAVAIDPHAAIEWLDEAKFGDPDGWSNVRCIQATALARESLDEATTILEASTSANTRAYGYVGLVDALPGLARERRRAFLERRPPKFRGR